MKTFPSALTLLLSALASLLLIAALNQIGTRSDEQHTRRQESLQQTSERRLRERDLSDHRGQWSRRSPEVRTFNLRRRDQLGYHTDHAQPVAAEASDKLYALFDEEGLNAQHLTLASFIRLAHDVGRELILLPFTSLHYQDEDGVRDLIRMEDYLNNALPYNWKTANPFNYNVNTVVQNHVSNEDFKAALLAAVTGTTALKYPVDCLEGETKTFVPQKDGSYKRVVTTLPYAEMVEKIVATDGPVCLKGRVPVNAIDVQVHLEPSASVLDITSRTFGEWQSSKPLSGKPLSALHLRRGDKCEGDGSHAVRCGPAESMPFLDICRQEEIAGGGLFVSTNEHDPKFLQVLHEAGCILANDLGLDIESIQDEADGMNRLQNDNWHSLNAAALQFSVETNILMTAEKAYSMGGSSLLIDMQRNRQIAGL